MNEVLSFRASDVDRDKLKEILARHAAYEQAHVFRVLVMRRLFILAVIAWALNDATHALSWGAFGVVAGIVAAGVALAVSFEWRAHIRLARELQGTQRSLFSFGVPNLYGFFMPFRVITAMA